jgi:hypothetical protein
MGLFNFNNIVDWIPGYYPNINEASASQRRSYSYIVKRIEGGHYIDVGASEAYLYAYKYELNERLLDFSGTDQWTDDLLSTYNNFIALYEEKNPKVVSYFYPWMLICAVLTKRDIRPDLERYIHFIQKNNIPGNYDLLASLFVTAHNLSSQEYVDSRYFKAFVGGDISQFMTSTGKKHYDDVLLEITDLLNSDFELTNSNYLFKLYNFEDGFIVVDNLDYLQPIAKKHLKEWDTNSRIKLKVSVPVYDKAKKSLFAKHITHEAENIFRTGSGLHKIGEGWISETLLYRQIESAFNDTKVLQHASPPFLGKQHYDIFLPEHKIALEYQGDQHHRPVDFFGGEETFAKGVERDKRKKTLSGRNGIKQFDVLPGYDLEELLASVAEVVYPSMSKEGLLNFVSDATTRARGISRSTLSQTEDKPVIIKRIADKYEDGELSEFKLEQRIKKLASMRKKSAYADDDGLNVSNDIFDKWMKDLEEIKQISKTDPITSNELAFKLFNSGYRAPAIYERIAINYRKIGDIKAEADLLLQMKRDFGYNLDDRLKAVLKQLGDDYR